MIHIRSCEMGMAAANCYIVHDDGHKGFIVDPGDRSEKLISIIRDEEIDLEYIILTHGHGDHIGGVESILEAFPAAKIVAHTDEKELLNDPSLNLSREVCGKAISFDAGLYVRDGERLKIGEIDLEFIHTPGHTKGGMCILMDIPEGGKALFSGDTLFMQSIGRTDFPGGDYSTLIKSIRTKLYSLPDDTLVLPGHMGATEIGNEKRYNPFVKA